MFAPKRSMASRPEADSVKVKVKVNEKEEWAVAGWVAESSERERQSWGPAETAR